MLAPALVAAIYGEGDLAALLISAVVSAAIGLPLRLRFSHGNVLDTRDAIAIAAFGWIVISAVSTLPFILHGSIPSFTDAFFEMMSGLHHHRRHHPHRHRGRATRADLLAQRDPPPRRDGLSDPDHHLPAARRGGSADLPRRVEPRPGDHRERFTARNRDAITYLWVIYLSLNLLQVILMCAGGMSLFDSLCHAFGTVSTSGYSPYNASIGHYDSAYFDWVIILFMFLGGVTFMLFYHAARREWKVIRINTELQWYLGFLLVFFAMTTWLLWRNGTYGFVDSLRYGTFQVISLLTTTGFTTADYELWPQAAQMLLLVVCFVGACAGSTTSGIKVVHYVVIWKFMVGAIKKIFFQPLAVLSVRINELPVDKGVVYLSICYFIINVFMVLGGGVIMTLIDDMDAITAMSSVIAALMNIGPGFGDVGPSENFAFISPVGKWFLAWNMLVGRLEMFSALVIFYPSFWRR